MRYLKFRAFNTVDKVMIENLNSPHLYHGQLIHDTDDVLMQMTGLIDNNGNDVYESDIVRWTNNKHYWVAVIEPCKHHENGQLYAIEKFHNCTVDEDGELYTYERSYSRDGARREIAFLDKSTEVIGNIYENPELLEGI